MDVSYIWVLDHCLTTGNAHIKTASHDCKSTFGLNISDSQKFIQKADFRNKCTLSKYKKINLDRFVQDLKKEKNGFGIFNIGSLVHIA